MSITPTNPSSTADDRLAAKRAALAAYAASTGIENPEQYNSLLVKTPTQDEVEARLPSDQEQELIHALVNGDKTWEDLRTYGICRYTKVNIEWGDLLKLQPEPNTNKPTFHAEHLMAFVISDLSKRGASPTAMLLAAYYASYFNPYKGALHPEVFRVRLALGITQAQYDDAMKEIGAAKTVLEPVKSMKVVNSGWWLRITSDAEHRILQWLNTKAAEHLRRSFDPTRRTLIKYNLRWSNINDPVTQLASVVFASRVGMDVEGWKPEDHTVAYRELGYQSAWLAKNFNITQAEAAAAIEKLEHTGLWDVEMVRPGCYFIRVSEEAAEKYERYYPYVLYTGKEAKKRGLDETYDYEYPLRRARGQHEAWLGTKSEWKTGDAREEWRLYPNEFPEADGTFSRDPDKKWVTVYEILDPITLEPFYVGITTRTMITRLLEHLTRPGITVSETQGEANKEYNPLMAARLKLYMSLGLEPIIRKRRVVQGVRAARAIERNTIRKLESQGVELLNLEHSEMRPDKEWKKMVAA